MAYLQGFLCAVVTLTENFSFWPASRTFEIRRRDKPLI
jgi:hypothetical protein